MSRTGLPLSQCASRSFTPARSYIDLTHFCCKMSDLISQETYTSPEEKGQTFEASNLKGFKFTPSSSYVTGMSLLIHIHQFLNVCILQSSTECITPPLETQNAKTEPHAACSLSSEHTQCVRAQVFGDVLGCQ